MNQKIKQTYTAPEAELLVVRFEENIMSPTGQSFGGKSSWSGSSGWSDDE